MAICKLILIILCMYLLAQKDPEIDRNVHSRTKNPLSKSRQYEEDMIDE